MAKHQYATKPPNISTMPPGVPFIIGNEASERFSFYGMRSILIVFMTKYLMDRHGSLAVMDETQAQGWFHQFVAAVYFLPLLGAVLADGLIGKYRVIFYLSIVYCFGHLSLALNDTRLGLSLGLMLIALGAGGIKPCVSANVGDQFGESNKHLLSKVFGWFYFSINAGSAVSIYLCPILLNNPKWGPHYAFGLPGVLMFLATVIFWAGRKKFVHIPPARSEFFKQFVSREGLSALGRLAIVYVFIIIFWALWDQSSGGEWTLQAQHLDLRFLGMNLLAEQVQVANGLLILAFIPLFNYGLYPLISRVFPLTPLRKIGIGLFLTALSFVVIWWIQIQIDGGATPSVWWQMLAYVILTAGEAMVSITGLEFSYTQAPNKMKSAVMALWLLVVFAGNEFVALLNLLVIPFLRRHGFPMEHAAYFRFFTLLMFGTAIIYIFVARRYREKTYLQSQEHPIDETIVAPVLAAGTPT
jgi:POT family proton-dependent oligopeptide transporter